jgi:hypothetical protein
MQSRNIRPFVSAALLVAGLAASSNAALTIFTDRASFEAAVAGTLQVETFTDSPLGNTNTLITQYGLVTMEIDRVSPNPGSNPGVLNFGGPTARVLAINVQDPSRPVGSGAPTITHLSFGGDINAFGADFIQLGVTSSSTDPIGDVTLTFGADSLIINPSLVNGSGFFGVISSTGASRLSFDFVGTSTLVNDIFQVDNVAFTFVPSPGAAALGFAALGFTAFRRRRA